MPPSYDHVEVSEIRIIAKVADKWTTWTNIILSQHLYQDASIDVYNPILGEGITTLQVYLFMKRFDISIDEKIKEFKQCFILDSCSIHRIVCFWVKDGLEVPAN